MSCTSSTASQYRARIEKLDSQIELANDALDKSLENGGVISYTFESAEGKQTTKRLDTDDFYKLIEQLESRRDWYYRKLTRQGVVAVNLRRKPLS